jgi:arylsulfatase A
MVDPYRNPRSGKTRLLAAFLLAALAWSRAPGVDAAAAEKPSKKLNFVFILIDDMGWTDLGCFGSDFYETPHIDRLAADGMRFTSAYAACPVCSPTRASIMTGKYPARLKLTNFIAGRRRLENARVLPADFKLFLELDEVTLAETLKPAGYTTAQFGKWHLGGVEHFPDRQGFDVSVVTAGRHFGSVIQTPPPKKLPDDTYLAEFLTDRAVSFIEENKDRPFFLHLCHFAVHIPLEAREKLVAKYEAKAKAHPGTRHNNPTYAAMVEHVDQSVGRVMETLQRLKIADRTVVVFTSDNGGLSVKEGPKTPSTTNAPLRAGKGYLYEGGIRVPLVICWPKGVQPGSVCDAPVSSVDFYPTILELARAKGDPKHVPDGESLVPLVKQTGSLRRDALYWHYPHFSNQGGMPGAAVRQGDWKLIRFYENERMELYNLKDDPGETSDLAARRRGKVAEMRGMLDRWLREVDATMCPPNPDYVPAKPLGKPFEGKAKPVPKKESAPDAKIEVHARQVSHRLTRTMTGACLEDVNHEVYGGIDSQMVFGESFQEPATESSDEVSGMWRPLRRGSATGRFSVVREGVGSLFHVGADATEPLKPVAPDMKKTPDPNGT